MYQQIFLTRFTQDLKLLKSSPRFELFYSKKKIYLIIYFFIKENMVINAITYIKLILSFKKFSVLSDFFLRLKFLFYMS